MEKRLKIAMAVVALVVVQALAGPLAYGQGTSTPEQAAKSRWEFDIIPYFWMAGLSGDITIKGVPANVNASFSDIASDLDFGAQMHMEAHKDRWGLFLDTTYMKLSMSGGATRVRSGPAGEVQETTQVQADIGAKEWLVELGGTYNAGRWSLGEGTAVAVDALGGVRYWYFKTNIDVGIQQTLGDFSEYLAPTISGTKEWIDPFVGVRLRFDLPKNFMVVLRGDVGGFDVGSQLSWNLAGYVGYNISRVVSLWAGYRALYVNYESGSGFDKFVFNVTMYGPVIGMGFRF
jgi:hypothetical protein